MNKRNAIKCIKRQKDKISDFGNDLIWINQTVYYFEQIFGQDSIQTKMLKSFRIPKPHPFDEVGQIEWVNTIQKLSKLLDEAIEAVEYNGTIKTDSNSKNELFGISKNIYIISVVSLVLGFIIGFYNNPKKAIIHVLKEHIHLPDFDADTPAKKPNDKQANPIIK